MCHYCIVSCTTYQYSSLYSPAVASMLRDRLDTNCLGSWNCQFGCAQGSFVRITVPTLDWNWLTCPPFDTKQYDELRLTRSCGMFVKRYSDPMLRGLQAVTPGVGCSGSSKRENTGDWSHATKVYTHNRSWCQRNETEAETIAPDNSAIRAIELSYNNCFYGW
jgi:hypothetical protein